MKKSSTILSTSHRKAEDLRLFLMRNILIAAAALLAQPAYSGVSMLQPAKRIDATKPLVLTLLFGDDDTGQRYRIPDTLRISAAADLSAPIELVLKRETAGTAEFVLKKGEYRKVGYTATLPPSLRGTLRIEPIDYDASAVLIGSVRPDAALGPMPDLPVASDGSAAAIAPLPASASGAPATAIAAPPAALDLLNASRISLNEPMYLIAGNSGGHTTAKFQISFKYRVFQPDDPRSRSLLDNLYFAYTQFSIWDLQAPSAPFRDTNYRPSAYYFLPNLGVANNTISRMSLAAGVEHESNGQDGIKSRGLNIAFVQPSISFGDLNDYHLTVAPKIYTYLGPLRDNPDIADYRGNLDLRLSFGKPDGIGFSTLLRKGRKGNAGSASNELSYPLARLVPGAAGYLFANYFYGYGESLLNYNEKLTPQLRIGFSLSR